MGVETTYGETTDGETSYVVKPPMLKSPVVKPPMVKPPRTGIETTYSNMIGQMAAGGRTFQSLKSVAG